MLFSVLLHQDEGKENNVIKPRISQPSFEWLLAQQYAVLMNILLPLFNLPKVDLVWRQHFFPRLARHGISRKSFPPLLPRKSFITTEIRSHFLPRVICMLPSQHRVLPGRGINLRQSARAYANNAYASSEFICDLKNKLI